MAAERLSQLAVLWTIFISPLCIAKPMAVPSFSEKVNGKKFPTTTSNIQLQRVGVLYSRNSGKHVRIINNKIDGLGTASDRNAKLVFESAGFGGQVRIKSYHGSCYICLSSKGHPVVKKGMLGRTLDSCVFIDDQHNGYTTYRSKINAKWFLGIRNNGRVKSALKMNIGQRAAHFL